jgi:DNA-binding response OmpR family regulator
MVVGELEIRPAEYIAIDRKTDRSVDVYVARLRHKLDEALPGRPYIHTHFGFGYRLSHPFHKAATGA